MERFGAHVTNHEDAVNEGIPDVSRGYQGHTIWVELKHVHEWPKMDNTTVRLHRYTLEQRAFLWNRGRITNHCFLLLQVEEELFLFGHTAAQAVGRDNITRQDLCDISLGRWTGSPGRALANLLATGSKDTAMMETWVKKRGI